MSGNKLIVVLFIFFALLGFVLSLFPVKPVSSLPAKKPISTTLKVYFGNQLNDPGSLHCERVYSVSRSILALTDQENQARAILQQLLAGPTEAEKIKGYFTSLNSGVRLNSVTISNGVARADFSEELNRGVAGSCWVGAIRAQITTTLKQFSEVQNVQISVAGRQEDILQP